MSDNIKSTIAYIREYKGRSIHLRNLSIITTFIIIPIVVLSILLFNITTYNANEEIKSAHLGILETVQRNVDIEFKKIEDMLYTLHSDNNINSLRMLDRINNLEYTTFDSLSNLFTVFKMSVNLNPNIAEMLVFFENSNTVVDAKGYIVPKEESKYNSLITEFIPVVEGTKKRFVRIYKSDGDNKSFYTIYKIPEYGAENRVFCIVNVKERSINEMINSTQDGTKYENMILDEQGVILCSKDSRDINRKIEEDVMSKLQTADGFFIRKAEKEQEAWIFLTSPQNGWKYISVVSMDRLYSKLNSTKQIFVMITLISVLMAVGISLFVTNKLSEPINVLLSFLDGQHDWIPEKELNKVKFGEIKMITKNVLGSQQEIQQLKSTLQERVQLLKKAQFSALQSQINPHFLYNALDSINWSIRKAIGLENTPSTLIHSLSEFLRFGLEGEENLISIRTEVENLRHYIFIQQFRYNNSFEVIWDIPEALYQYKIIKITLQPMVENAIAHGINNLGNYGILRISGALKDGNIIISVWDNGNGIEKDKLAELIDYIEDMDVHVGDSIGLKNIHLRHRILFGEQYGVTMESKFGVETKVNVSFPAIPV